MQKFYTDIASERVDYQGYPTLWSLSLITRPYWTFWNYVQRYVCVFMIFSEASIYEDFQVILILKGISDLQNLRLPAQVGCMYELLLEQPEQKQSVL